MQRQKKSTSPYAGFTLIELLIVVAIIAILAAIAIPNFLEAQTRARVSRAKADIRTIVTALESYKVDSNKYISGEELTNPQANKDVWGPSFNPQMVRLTSPIAYMSSLPESSPFDPWFESFYAARGFKFRGYKYLGGDWWTSFAGGSNGFTPRETYSLPTSKGGWGFLSEGCLNSEFILFVPGPIRRISIGDGTNHFTIYDPTNGTVSRGEILYVGGPRAEEFNSFK